jgi:hypothetical protein
MRCWAAEAAGYARNGWKIDADELVFYSFLSESTAEGSQHEFRDVSIAAQLTSDDLNIRSDGR